MGMKAPGGYPVWRGAGSWHGQQSSLNSKKGCATMAFPLPLVVAMQPIHRPLIQLVMQSRQAGHMGVVMVAPEVEESLSAIVKASNRDPVTAPVALALDHFLQAHVDLPFSESGQSSRLPQLVFRLRACLVPGGEKLEWGGSWAMVASPGNISGRAIHFDGQDHAALLERARQMGSLLTEACLLPSGFVFVGQTEDRFFLGEERLDMARRAREAFEACRANVARRALDAVLPRVGTGGGSRRL